MSAEVSDWPEGDVGVRVMAAHQIVAQSLRRAIHLGELSPGAKLPAERLLASRLDVSRITLREAIRKLEGEGYVTVERGSRGGTFVRADEMRRAEVRSWIRKRRDELTGIFDFRLANERCAAERAASRATAKDIDELRDIVAESKVSEDIGALRTSDVRFHLRVADLSGNALVRQSVEEARAALYVPFRAIPVAEMRDRTIPQHTRIVDAIASGDPKRAARATEAHLKPTSEQILELAGVASG